MSSLTSAEYVLPSHVCTMSEHKVETPYHDNDLILTPVISPQSG
jgi:hypothetical protein